MPAPLREHYTKADDSKFKLTLDGEPSESARVKEFRDSAIASKKALDELRTKYDGVDVDEYGTLKTNAANGGDVAALKAQLATRDTELATDKAPDAMVPLEHVRCRRRSPAWRCRRLRPTNRTFDSGPARGS